MKLKFSFKLVLVTFFVSLFGVLPASEIQAKSHLVTPLVINLDLEKRDIVQETITLTNTSERTMLVYASVNNVAMDGNGVIESFVQKSVADRTNTATTWIEISRQRITLAPGEVREIPFTVRMNPLTEPGNYNVFIGFAEASNRPKAETKVAQGTAPGTIVSISVDQKQNQFLRLEKFSIDKFVTNQEDGTFRYILANPGTVDVVPAGEIIFYDTTGEEVASLDLNSEKKKVPAETNAEFTMNIPPEFSLGKYKAFLSVEYGEFMTASVQDTAYFYILPLRFIIILFVSILVVTIILVLLINRRNNHGLHDDGSENVALFIKEGKSEDQHHDIDLSKKHET